MKVSTAEQSTNFNGTVRIMRFGYTDRADNIKKSLSGISKFIEHENYDLFVKNEDKNIKVFAQKSTDYAKEKQPEKIYSLNQNSDKLIPKTAKEAIKNYIYGNNTEINTQNFKSKIMSIFSFRHKNLN